MEVRRHLVEAASRENLPIKMSMGKLSASPTDRDPPAPTSSEELHLCWVDPASVASR